MRVTSLGQKKEKMKYKLVLVGILMGVLSSCTTSYRIKSVTHPNGIVYHFPQKRSSFGEWVDMSRIGSYTKEWAHSVIMDDKELNSTKVKYYSYEK